VLPVLVTPGDPAGIGPEVVCKAARCGDLPPFVVIGDGSAMERAASMTGPRVQPVQVPEPVRDAIAVFEPHGTEPIEVTAIRCAVEHILAGRARALVTGPIHKGRLAARGFHHPGHTGFLGELCGVTDPVMAFVGGVVRVALVTVHLPLRRVPWSLTTEGVIHTARVANEALKTHLRLQRPRLAITGLNPHAGDDGLLGSEEREIISPAVEVLRSLGVDARGPMSAESAFVKARRAQTDLVVAMYHDQGLVPLKALGSKHTINWTLGLPIVRTSVDHGTADDIAWTGVANPASMVAAIRWAHQISR